MRYLDRFLYNRVILPSLIGASWAVAPLHGKIRRGLAGRNELWKELSGHLGTGSDPGRPRFWIHASSTGEFLQSLPVLEAIRGIWPNALLACSYFSPSADRVVRSTELVNCPTFLPIDTRKNMSRFFSLLEPDMLLFSRYDVWPNMVWEARRRSCPAVLLNATLSLGSSRMRRFGRGFFGRLYSDLELICAASEDDWKGFRALEVPAWKIETTGDTKYDETYRRVSTLSEGQAHPLALSLSGRQVIIGGSTWEPDEVLLLEAYARIRPSHGDSCLVLVPHEPTPKRVGSLLDRAVLLGLRPETFSSLEGREWRIEGDVLIVDALGILARLYGLARIALVGGGFSTGVHNVLEPAALGLPVLMGPNHGKSHEARALVQEGGAIVVRSVGELEMALRLLLEDRESRRSMGMAALENVRKNLGARDRVLAVLRATFPALFPQPLAGKE